MARASAISSGLIGEGARPPRRARCSTLPGSAGCGGAESIRSLAVSLAAWDGPDRDRRTCGRNEGARGSEEMDELRGPRSGARQRRRIEGVVGASVAGVAKEHHSQDGSRCVVGRQPHGRQEEPGGEQSTGDRRAVVAPEHDQDPGECQGDTGHQERRDAGPVVPERAMDCGAPTLRGEQPGTMHGPERVRPLEHEHGKDEEHDERPCGIDRPERGDFGVLLLPSGMASKDQAQQPARCEVDQEPSGELPPSGSRTREGPTTSDRPAIECGIRRQDQPPW